MSEPVKRLNDQEYADKGGQDCPVCHATPVETDGELQADGYNAWQDVRCLKCDHTWTDYYQLHGYNNLKAPDGTEVTT